MATIHSKYIQRYQLPGPNCTILRDYVIDPNSRILEITDNCNAGNTESLLQIKSDSRSDSIKKLLSESSNLFFIIVKFHCEHFDNTICERIIRDVCDAIMNCGKYFLIEICHGVKSIVRYIFNGEREEKLPNEELADFFDAVGESLLLSRVNASSFHHIKNVSSMPLPLHCILMRLLRTCDLPWPEDIENSIVKNLVRCSNINGFRAFLDLPHIDDGASIQHTALTTKMVHYKHDATDETLLFFAASGNVGMLKLLLRLGADVYAENLYSETASDHTKESGENLLVLLEHDAKFPRNFHEIYEKARNCNDEFLKRVCKIFEERKDLHQAIVDKDQKSIALFEERYPNLKFAYTFTGKPTFSRAATTTALVDAREKDDYTTYLYLKDKGFCVNDNELYFMTTADKNKVNAIILNRLKIEQQSHVNFLSGRTFVYGVGVTKQHEYKYKILGIYKKLNDFRKLKSILKVVEHSKSLTVSIDFGNKSVVNLDLNASNTMDGLTYHNLGRIYLSVAGKNDTEIGGLIIHELTHFALHIIFNNHGYPYYKFDADKEKEFKEIVDKVGQFREYLPQVVDDVYVAYSKSSWPKELIARVPQLISARISSYNGMAESEEEEEKGENGMADLFKFYCDHVLPYMERLTKNPENFFIKREVNQLNEFLRHADEIEKWKIELDTTCLEQAIYDGQGVKKVICDIPRLFLTDIYNEVVQKGLIHIAFDGADKMKQSEKYMIFASIKDFANSFTSPYIQRIWNLTSSITLVLDVESFFGLDSELQANCLRQLTSEGVSKNIILFGPDHRAMDSIPAAQGQHFTQKYTWQHLKKSYREALLSQEINFQGAMVPLNKLIDDAFSSDDIPIKRLIGGERITIPKSTDDYDEKMFVERKVKYLDRECAINEIVSLAAEPITSFILSGCPGSGQSTVMAHIASLLKDKNPHFWVARVAVGQLTSASNYTTEGEQFTQHFLTTSSTPDYAFEFSLFERLYQQSGVIFLFDSFVDLSDDCVEQAISLIKILSERSQLWITVHADSPATTRLTEELLNKMVLELLPFVLSDHLSCITKIWRNQLGFDATNETVFQSYAAKLIDYYQPFIEFPKLTATIADKYLTCVNEHITRYSDEPFIPGNIYTNDGIIDIYDLHKDFYSEKIHQRHQQDETKESAKTVVLGMDMFTAFEQFADCCLERSDDANKPLAMYTNGADDLLRNGILDHSLEISHIGTGRYFFLSNYIVRSMESSFRLYGRLCNVISFRQMPGNYKLLKLIDGRMKDSILFCGTVDYSGASFAQNYDSNYRKLTWDDVMYLLDEDAILLLCFILGFPSTPLMESFEKCSLFWRAAAKGLRCVIEILWNISNEKFNIHLGQADSLGLNPFQYAFMHFPRSDVDVIKDTTTAFGLSEALRKREIFQETLNISLNEKYQRSTLNFFVEKILNSRPDDERKILINQYNKHPAINERKISGRHFDEAIEGKWMAMTHLQFPLTDWMKLTTETIFENVIHLIFNPFNNHVVTKFYKWAETKTENADTFKAFVANTFVNFFWNCTSAKHGRNIVNFVRTKINMEEVLMQRGIKIFNDKFDNKIAAYHEIFTAKEFEIILFRMPMHDSESNLMTKICCCDHQETIYETFTAIPLETIIEQVKVSVGLVHKLLWFMVSTLEELRDESLIKFITDFIDRQDPAVISEVLVTLDTITYEGSFFNLAFIRRDMFMVKLMWKMAKSYLNEEQFRCLLLDPYNSFMKLVPDQTTNEFLDQPPGMHNINCETACFEFQPFKLKDQLLPKFAISLSENVFIGRCKASNADSYFLCKVVLNKPDAVEFIGFRRIQPMKDSLELLIGKGLVWIKHNDHNDKQLYFRFKDKLLKRRKDNIELVDMAAVGNFYYLAYDDVAARETETVNGFCYYQGRSL